MPTKKKAEKPQVLTGVIQVTGEHDTGKTTFALECGAAPDKILFFDDDLKGKVAMQDLREAGVEFGGYIDLIDMGKGLAEYDFHTKVMDMLKEIEPGQYDVIIWDTWTHFADTCHSYVLVHPSEFKKNWAPMGTIKGAQQWKEARRYEAMIISYLNTLAPTVILITHLKDQYMGKVKVPGKQIPANSKALDRVLRFRIWLRLNPNGRPVPIGLVMKRLDVKFVDPDDGKIRTINVLPRKIQPLPNENSLWDTIGRYRINPVGNAVPMESELPDEYEMAILDGTMTKDQSYTLRSMIESGLLEEPDEGATGKDVDQEKLATVIQMHNENKPLPLIARAVELPVVIVSKWIDTLPKEHPAQDVDFEKA